jgi:hypothetical protein
MSRKQTKKSPETRFDGTVPFDAQDMERRYRRLKAEGRLPSLKDVLAIVAKVHAEYEDRQFLKSVGIAPSEKET